jgi:hypothetical protein
MVREICVHLKMPRISKFLLLLESFFVNLTDIYPVPIMCQTLLSTEDIVQQNKILAFLKLGGR